MNRKNFLTSTSSLLTFLALSSQARSREDIEDDDPGMASIIPPYMKAGDLIGITAPAGYITAEEIQPALRIISDWGFRIKLGQTIGKREFTFGGTDEERADDFQQFLDDPKVKTILCARGGYGTVRIIDKLKWDHFRVRPKWIIGFSDMTVFHSHLNRNFGIATIHSKMCNSFPEDWNNAEPIQVDTIESIRKAIIGERMKYQAIPNAKNKTGSGEGILIGGNLKMLETLAGTSSDIRTAGKLLFVEDTGEYMYNIDRMFWNLKRTGKLNALAGLIVGGFKVRIDEDGDDFGRTLQDVVLEKVKNFRYPVCFDFPVGHQKNNYALKCGKKHRLSVDSARVTLVEI